MVEQLYSELMSKFGTRFSGEDIKYLEIVTTSVLNNYTIDKKSTDLAVYDGNYIPECVKVYLVSKKIEGCSQGTLDQYELKLRLFFESVRKPLNDITTNDIRLFFYEYQKQRGISNRTLDGYRAAINAFFGWAFNEKYIEINPALNVKAIKYQSKNREYLTDIELEKIRNACKNIRERTVVEVLYSTACRVSELCNMKKSDVDFYNGEIKVIGKGNKERTTYLNARAKIALANYLETRTDDNAYLLVGSKSPHNQLTKSGVEKMVKKIASRTDIDRPIHPHLFRHTASSMALQRGMDITEIQKMLGHSNINTTMIYSKTTQENVKASHRKYII